MCSIIHICWFFKTELMIQYAQYSNFILLFCISWTSFHILYGASNTTPLFNGANISLCNITFYVDTVINGSAYIRLFMNFYYVIMFYVSVLIQSESLRIVFHIH